MAFEIFSEYREIFERYLMWRNTMFPEDESGLLFPLVTSGRAPMVAPSFAALRTLCTKIGLHFVAPQALRKIRINWLLRRSCDIEMTAEMHAHSAQTLISQYEQPSLQLALTEISRFHAQTDPALASPGPGLCVKMKSGPAILPFVPVEATTPDCVSPAGCLFCVHQRDIDSEDHVWSLASYRYLKSLELSRYRPPRKVSVPHPASIALDRLTAKICQFSESSKVRSLWVEEALSRIAEEHYHPKWDGFIRLMEASR